MRASIELLRTPELMAARGDASCGPCDQDMHSVLKECSTAPCPVTKLSSRLEGSVIRRMCLRSR